MAGYKSTVALRNTRYSICDICIKADVCSIAKEFEIAYRMQIAQCDFFKDRNGFVELPFKVGSKVFVTPDRGRHFHKATLYGCDEKGTFLVFVNDHNLTDEEKPIVANPCTHVFYDWFIKVYTKEEAEQALKERSNA